MAQYKVPILADGLSASKAVATDSQKRLISTDNLSLDTLTLPSTSDSSTGILFQGSSRMLHTYGSNNFFLGPDAGNFSVTGSNNACIGAGAGQALTTASFNTCIGRNSLFATTEGGYNLSIGALSMRNNITGYDNVAIGPYALYENTSGYRNIGIGRSAMYGVTTGFSNIGFGDFVLRYCGSGEFNIGIGRMALYNLTSSVQNIAIGTESGYNCTGNRNIFIGGQSGYRQTTASDKLIIDNRRRSSSAVELTDALIVGTMDASPSNQILRVNGLIESPSDSSLNFGYSDVDGSWRFIRSENNLLVQRRESGSWVTKHTFSA